jgi:hypothetical protein
MYRLPGGTERIINTTSTTVVNDIIEEICLMLNVRNPVEMEEFSLYCIIEGGIELIRFISKFLNNKLMKFFDYRSVYYAFES